jgi:hypothetical protein
VEVYRVEIDGSQKLVSRGGTIAMGGEGQVVNGLAATDQAAPQHALQDLREQPVYARDPRERPGGRVGAALTIYGVV